MQNYRSTLDKINGARDKTDNSIGKIKGLMQKAEQDTQRVEGIIRGRCQ